MDRNSRRRSRLATIRLPAPLDLPTPGSRPTATRVLLSLAALIIISALIAIATIQSTNKQHHNMQGAPNLSTSPPRISHTEGHFRFTANMGSCVAHASARPGLQTISITNASDRGLEITLNSATDNRVLGEIEQFGTQTTRDMHVSLGPGQYRFTCYFDEAPQFTSNIFTVGGDAASNPAVLPVSENDLFPPTFAYQKWVTHQLPAFVQQVNRLTTDIHNGDTAKAKNDWYTAHYTYEILGAAYGVFGDLDTAINGRASGLNRGADDPAFTGFHAIERLLFTPATARDPALIPLSEQLNSRAAELQTDMPSFQIDPLDIGLRAHEILENTLQFTLTGRDDFGAHAATDTILANIAGTEELMTVLRPLLTHRYDQLSRTDAALNESAQLTHRFASTYPHKPLTDYKNIDRKNLNAAISGDLELLAPIAAICDVRRTR